MEKQMVFHVLGIAETKDEGAIKKAYLGLLKERNPEDHPEAFKELRKAYEEALKLARETEREADSDEKSPLDKWMDRVDRVYGDIRVRADKKRWQELLDDPVCTGLDTALAARDKMLTYLMQHVYLPQEVWILLDKGFQIVSDIDILKDQYPPDFLKYAANNIKYKEVTDYRFFQVTDPDNMNADAYIEMLLQIKAQNDNSEFAPVVKMLFDLRSFGLYHPLADVETIRFLLAEKRVDEASRIAARLLTEYGDDPYILLYAGQVKWDKGETTKAYRVWERILQVNPNHYLAKRNIAGYFIEQKKYHKAQEILHDLAEIGNQDPIISDFLKTTNVALIEEYKQKLAGIDKTDQEYDEIVLKLAGCQFDCGQLTEVLQTVEAISLGEKQKYSFISLYSRTLFQLNEFGQALPYLRRLLELVLNSTDEDREEYEIRLKRLPQIYYLIGVSQYKLGDTDEWIEMLQKAVDEEKDSHRGLFYLHQMGAFYLERSEYGKSIEVCDRIIAADSNYFLAYVTRQEAFFKLKNWREVIGNYFAAIRIYPGYFKPYLLAARVYYENNAVKDGLAVLAQARENKIEFTDLMKLYEAKMMVASYRQKEELESALKIALELYENRKSGSDLEDISDVEHTIALIYWKQGKLEAAIDIYNQLKAKQDDVPVIWYRLGNCYESKGMMEQAVICYEKALQLQDGYYDAFYRLSRLYEERYKESYIREDFNKALMYISKQIEKGQENYALIQRSNMYLMDYQIDAAIGDFEKSAEQNPENMGDSYNNLGYCYKLMQDWDRAIEYLQKAITHNAGNSSGLVSMARLATCYFMKGDYEKAISWRKELISEGEEKWKWFYTGDQEWQWFYIGDYYKEMGRYTDALAAYRKNSDGGEYFIKLAHLFWRQGKRNKALNAIKQYVKKSPPGERSDRLFRMAIFYLYRLGSCEKAVTTIEKALIYEKDHAKLIHIYAVLAEAYQIKGDNKKAEEAARSAKESLHKSKYGDEERYVEPAYLRKKHLSIMGGLALALEQVELVEECLERLAKGYPCRDCRDSGCYEYYMLQGRFYKFKGETANAVKAFERALNITKDYGYLVKEIEHLRNESGVEIR